MLVPPQTSIENCSICTQIAQRVALDYETGDARPPFIDALETIAAERTEENNEAWHVHAVLRCPACWTCYAHYRSKDEGHSFMDPTCDLESVARLTLHATLGYLGRFHEPGVGASRAVLEERLPETIPTLQRVVREGRAPNWHIRKYASECTIHAALMAREWSPIEMLVVHADASIRVEALLELLDLTNGYQRYLGDEVLLRALQEQARAFLALHPPAPQVEAIFAEPVAGTCEVSMQSRVYVPTDTYSMAAQIAGKIAQAKMPVSEAIVERLADLMDKNSRWRFDAVWGLIFIIDEQSTPARQAAIRARLDQLPTEMRESPLVSMLDRRIPK